MSNAVYLRLLLQLIAFSLLHLLVLDQLSIPPWGFSFIYIAPLLWMPVTFDRMALMFIAFVQGLIIDAFQDTPGVNAAAAVFLTYLRPYVLEAITPRLGYDNNPSTSLQAHGWIWYSSYSLALIFTHHLLMFLLESFSFYQFGHTLLKTVSSTLYTYFILVLIQLSLPKGSN